MNLCDTQSGPTVTPKFNIQVAPLTQHVCEYTGRIFIAQDHPWPARPGWEVTVYDYTDDSIRTGKGDYSVEGFGNWLNAWKQNAMPMQNKEDIELILGLDVNEDHYAHFILGIIRELKGHEETTVKIYAINARKAESVLLKAIDDAEENK